MPGESGAPSFGKVTRKSPVSAAARRRSSSRNWFRWTASVGGSVSSHCSNPPLGTSSASSSRRDRLGHCAGSISTALFLEGGVQQQPGFLPVPANGARRYATRLGDLLHREAGEIAHFDDLHQSRVQERELLQCFIHLHEKFFANGRGFPDVGSEGITLFVAAASLRQPLAHEVHNNGAHDSGGEPQEVRAIARL